MTNLELTSSGSPRFDTFLNRAEKSGNTLLASAMRYDTEIESIQRSIAEDYDGDMRSLDYFEAQVSALKSNIDDNLNSIDTVAMTSWNDYFRLLNHRHFIEQRIVAPFAFADHQLYEARRYLANGTYGLNAQIIEKAMTLYDYTNDSPVQQRQLLGVINEETAMALINRSEVPSQLAVSSSTADDYFHKSDIDFWYLHKRQPHRARIQVKSTHPSFATFLKNKASPVIHVYAKDFDNKSLRGDVFATSRRILQEVHGSISDADKDLLDKTHSRFIQQVHAAAQRK